MGSSDIISQIGSFFAELYQSLSSGLLFFGSTLDFVRACCDIILVTIICYGVFLFLRHSRAWQLIKGIIFIYAFVLLCGLFGLEIIGFLFSRFLYIFAILFVVVFQPELRRAFETVGLKSFTSLHSLFSTNEVEDKAALSSFINEVCLACKEMARTKTGALILIERTSRLDELLTQENVVRFDSTVSNSVLQSIFYNGSPMHDGGVLIRNGRIIAARCHVPLSQTMFSLTRTGTRHRAAVGASEMGDTVAVCISEERGKVSIAVNGHLYEMKDETELEANLSYLLGLTIPTNNKSVLSISKIANKAKKVSRKNKKTVNANTNADNLVTEDIANAPSTQLKIDKNIVTSEAKSKKKRKRDRVNFAENALLLLCSFLVAVGLWVYIQIDNNPVVETKVEVPITYNENSLESGLDVSYPVASVEIAIVGRQNMITSLDSSDIVASIDFSSVNQSGVYELPVNISSADTDVYFRVEQQLPETISVTVYSATQS